MNTQMVSWNSQVNIEGFTSLPSPCHSIPGTNSNSAITSAQTAESPLLKELKELTFHNQSGYGIQKIPKQKLKWTDLEDDRLINAVNENGTESWIKVAMHVPGRNSKQCRERWIGQLCPKIVKTSWTTEEDNLLLKQHSVLGNKWTLIAKMLPGRSAINIKNRWSKLKKGAGKSHDSGKIGGAKSSKKPFYGNINPENSFSINNYNGFAIQNQISQQPMLMQPSLQTQPHYNMNVANTPSNIYLSSSSSSASSSSNSKSSEEEETNVNGSDTQETVIIERDLRPQSRPIIFEFPPIDGYMFGEEFARFQETMLEKI